MTFMFFGIYGWDHGDLVRFCRQVLMLLIKKEQEN